MLLLKLSFWFSHHGEQIYIYTIKEQHARGQDADALTYFLTALLSSVVHDDGGVDEGAGSGHVLSKQAFHFVRTQADRQVEELHRSKNGDGDTLWFHQLSHVAF